MHFELISSARGFESSALHEKSSARAKKII